MTTSNERLHTAPYPVESFAILDDNDDMALHQQRPVRVDPKVGLWVKEARQVIAILALPWRQKASPGGGGEALLQRAGRQWPAAPDNER
jgi:hypothetical protein